MDLVLPADPEAPSTAPDAIIRSHWVLRDGRWPDWVAEAYAPLNRLPTSVKISARPRTLMAAVSSVN